MRAHRADRFGQFFDARLVRAKALGARECGHQALGTHRLHQVIERLYFECIQRVFVVGGDENHRGRVIALRQMARDLDAVHVGHVHVEQNDVGLQAVGFLEPADATFGFADQLQRHLFGTIAQHLAKTRARRWFVVDDHHV